MSTGGLIDSAESDTISKRPKTPEEVQAQFKKMSEIQKNLAGKPPKESPIPEKYLKAETSGL